MGLLFSLMFYLTLYFSGKAGSLVSSDEVMRLFALAGCWFGYTILIEWFGREPKS